MSHTIHAITATHSLCNWKFASPDLPHLFVSLSQPPPLWQTLVLCVYESISFKKNIHLFGCLGSSLWHIGSLSVACRLQSMWAWLLLNMLDVSSPKGIEPTSFCTARWILNQWIISEVHDYVSICYICMFVLDSAYK